MKVYFESVGWTNANVIINVFVRPQKDGSAYFFSADGSQYQYWWAHPEVARVFDSKELPKELWFSIRHGENTVKVPFEKESDWTWSDLIYNQIFEEEMKAAKEVNKKIGSVNTLDEFKELYPTIKKSHTINQKVMDKLLGFYNIPYVPVNNGEIGIANYQKYCIYQALLVKLGLEEQTEKNNG